MGILFVGELANQANIFLDLLSVMFHLPNIVFAPLLLQSLQYLLVLLHDLQQLTLTVGLI